MIKVYRNFRRKRIENKLRLYIRVNEESIKQFNKVSDRDAEDWVKSSVRVCMGYFDYDKLRKTTEKYGVDPQLIERQIETIEEASEAYDNLIKRYNKYDEKLKERINIDMFKKAILELVQEGKINISPRG